MFELTDSRGFKRTRKRILYVSVKIKISTIVSLVTQQRLLQPNILKYEQSVLLTRSSEKHLSIVRITFNKLNNLF